MFVEKMLPIKIPAIKLTSSLVLLSVLSVLWPHSVHAAEINRWLDLDIRGELALVDTRDNPRYLRPWFEGGTGQLEHHENDDFWLGPQYASIDLHNDSDWSMHINTQWHRRPEAGFGATEGWVAWKPLPVNGYRFSARAGWFYPAMSLENTDTAWTSPYTQNFSAINSWFAEELKARGLEIAVKRPGRLFASSHDLEAVFGVFQGNDALGTVLAWRGFAVHNLQTSLGERVDFANYPSIRAGVLALQPAWVEPNREIDGRTGWYGGVHWTHDNRSEFRAYYYDNRADPAEFHHGQYAWHTRFSHLAWQYAFDDSWLFVSQWLRGSTEMGNAKAVYADFDAWFALLNWQGSRHGLSVRYDVFDVVDRDRNAFDNNDGNGDSVTLAWHYALNDYLQLGLEYVRLKSYQASRSQWAGWRASAEEENIALTLLWRW